MTGETPERYTWIFTPAPDPRDARIAQLEAALNAIRDEVRLWRAAGMGASIYFSIIMDIAIAALMPSPEGDMAVTVEELDA